jgi:(R,R)-butanediol dehydrogenase / meso-butanediol dehydrogenase / diacetyl reductase
MSLSRMRAAVWQKAHDLRAETVSIPELRVPDDLRVKVGACGKCDRDLRE